MATEKIIKQFTGNNFIESKDILGATAKGTEENFYLDPIPRLNKLGYVYSNIVSDIGARIAARTDSIKMNRDNMDYTNTELAQVLGLHYNELKDMYPLGGQQRIRLVK